MSNTERSRRHREQERLRRAEAERITQKYFGGHPPLSAKERRRLLREMSWRSAYDRAEVRVKYARQELDRFLHHGTDPVETDEVSGASADEVRTGCASRPG